VNNLKKETGMSTRAMESSSERNNLPPETDVPVGWEELDDESLDDLYAVQEADIDDFNRGGK
jgi:hypothetical protein